MRLSTMNASPPLSRVVRALTLVLLLSVWTLPASAQNPDDGGAVTVGGGALTIGGLLQTDAYVGRAAGDGFRIRTTRLRLGGEAKDLQYVVQTDFSSPSVLLDAFARIPLTEQVRITAGLFKTPFGKEILTGRPNLLFAERSRAANAIPPGRQAGATLSANLGSDQITATAGAFNGTPGLKPNDNDLLLYVGRLNGTIPLGSTTLEGGANAGYSIDDAVPRPRPDSTALFSGTRALFGADAQLTGQRWLLAGEVNVAQLSPTGIDDTQTAFGYYLAGGIDVVPNHQVLARFDQYNPDVPGVSAPANRVTLGYNVDPSPMLRFLLNYEAAVDDLGGGLVTARLQVALR